MFGTFKKVTDSLPSVGYVYLQNNFFKAFTVTGYNPEEHAWEDVLEWEQKYGNVLQMSQKRYLGYYNPPHDFGNNYRSFVACLFFCSALEGSLIDKYGVMRYPDHSFLGITLTQGGAMTERSESLSLLLEGKHGFELDYSVHFDEYQFSCRESNQVKVLQQLYPIRKKVNNTGQVENIRETGCITYKFEQNKTDRAVDWYARDWCMAKKGLPHYSNYRVFVTNIRQQQILMISSPEAKGADVGTASDRMQIGGKYLKFTCNAMLLRKTIPKRLKQILREGYQLDSERFFFEEHFKHSENMSNMMMANIYFPIL